MNTNKKQLKDKINNNTYMKRIQIIKNSKNPAFKWSNPKYHMDTIDHFDYNDAILTGKINNLIVLDVDMKDNGMGEYATYTSKFGEINTMTQSTPNGGIHLFFKYDHIKPEIKYIIQNTITNRSKYRKSGLDIRTNGGYIMSAPSIINGISYKIIKDVPILEMPESLVYWLLENSTEKENKKIKSQMQVPQTRDLKLIYDISDDELTSLLNDLPSEYLDNFDKWWRITDVMKSMNKYIIWDKWSSKSSKYDKQKNITIYNSTKGILNINYLMTLLEKPLVPSHKPVPMTTIRPNRSINKKYVSECISYDEFKMNKTIIIKSCTGTGKTTAVAQYMEKYMSDNKKKKLKMISITNLISLGRQHIESFKKCNIDLVSYDSPDIDIRKDNIYVCINSLYKLFKDVDSSYFENCVLYIDEITTFIECLTHNDLLDNNIKDIYGVLVKMVKKCDKLIVSDATINQTTFDFVKHRETYYYIENTFKKFKDVKAVHYKDENDFYDKIKDCIKNDKYFLFGSDWNARITDMYNHLIDENPEKADTFLLITSDTKVKVGNASEQFKNKFVFYSPSITTAVDFSIDVAQDVFIYLSGKSILPTGTFQQTTRTRNISTLHYYADAQNRRPLYKNLNDLCTDYREMTTTSYKLNDICLSLDENDEDKMIENMYFKLYTYNEYLKDCYESNKNIHFKNILRENGFLLSSEGERKCLSKDVTEKFTEIREDIEEKLFDEFLEANDKTVEKFKTIKERTDMLNINNVETMKTYKNIIMNKYEMEEHMNIIRMLKDEEYVKFRIEDAMNGAYKVKTLTNIYSKINVLNQTMKPYNITNIFTSKIDTFKISDGLYALIKKLFRITRGKPEDEDEYKKLIAVMIKHLGDIVISKLKRERVEGGRTSTTTYYINKEKIETHIELDRLTNYKCTNYSEDILKYFKIEIAEEKENDVFLN